MRALVRLGAGGAVLAVALAFTLLSSRGLLQAPWSRELNWAIDFALGSTAFLSAVAGGLAAHLAVQSSTARDAGTTLAAARPQRLVAGSALPGAIAGLAGLAAGVGIAVVVVVADAGYHAVPWVWPLVLLAAAVIASWAFLGGLAGLLVPRGWVPAVTALAPLVLMFLHGLVPGAALFASGGATGSLAGLRLRTAAVCWPLVELALLDLAGVLVLVVVTHRSRPVLASVGGAVTASLVIGAMLMLPTPETFDVTTASPSRCTGSGLPRVCLWPDSGMSPERVQAQLRPYQALLVSRFGARVREYDQSVGNETSPPSRGLIDVGRGTGGDADRLDNSQAPFVAASVRACPAFVGGRPMSQAAALANLITGFYLMRVVRHHTVGDLSAAQLHWLDSTEGGTWVRRAVAGLESCEVRLRRPAVWADFG